MSKQAHLKSRTVYYTSARRITIIQNSWLLLFYAIDYTVFSRLQRGRLVYLSYTKHIELTSYDRFAFDSRHFLWKIPTNNDLSRK
jgi:hypothetical protein